LPRVVKKGGSSHCHSSALNKTSLIHLVNEIARLLKLDGQEKRGRDIDALHVKALRVTTAGKDLIGPEIPTRPYFAESLDEPLRRDRASVASALFGYHRRISRQAQPS
jgi:hypothetical protein